jgi:hypothetical protein
MIDDSKSYYVSNIMWANLGNEVCMDKGSVIINY